MKLKLSPFIFFIFSTTVVSVATLCSNIFVIRFLTEGLGAEKFGAYSLANRIMATVIPISTLVLGPALAKHISLSRGEHARYDYLLGGCLIGGFSGFLVLVLGFVHRGFFSGFLFPGSSHERLFLATLFLIAGYSAYIVLNGYYFGTGRILRANVMQLLMGVLAPLLIAGIFSRSGRTAWIVFLMGGVYFSAIFPLFFHLSRAIVRSSGWKRIRERVRELWQYGLPRIPQGFLLAGLLSIGPFLAAHFGSIRDVGYLVIGQAVFRLAEIGTSAFHLVTLPKVGELLAEGRREFLEERIEDIFTFVIHVGLFLTLHLILWADQVVYVWVGSSYREVIPLMRIFMLVITPYFAYVMLSPIIEASEKKAINIRNLWMAFFLALLLAFVLGKSVGLAGLAIATTLGFIGLGFFTVAHFRRAWHLSSRPIHLGKIVAINTGFIFIAFGLKILFTRELEGFPVIIAGVTAELVFFIFYVLILWKCRFRWLIELKKRLFESVSRRETFTSGEQG